jgi:hypothetical protein
LIATKKRARFLREPGKGYFLPPSIEIQSGAATFNSGGDGRLMLTGAALKIDDP